MKTSDLTRMGLCAALTAVATMIIKFPTPATQGYVNVGDTVIFVSAILFGPNVGMVAGGIGSALADLLGGYFHWVPFTFIIKGVEGWLVGRLAVSFHQWRWTVPIMILGGGWMVVGYCITEIFIYGWGAAVAEVPGNIVQAGVSLLIALPLTAALRKLRQE